jgi:hypothetical protein
MVLRALLLIALLGRRRLPPSRGAATPRLPWWNSWKRPWRPGNPTPSRPRCEPEAAGLRFFASLASPVPTRVIIKERDRTPREPDGERLLIEVFIEYGQESTITTWRLDLARTPPRTARQIVEMEELTPSADCTSSRSIRRNSSTSITSPLRPPT